MRKNDRSDELFRRNQRIEKIQEDITEGRLSKKAHVGKDFGIKGNDTVARIPEITSMTWLHSDSFSADKDAVNNARNIIEKIQAGKSPLYKTNNIEKAITDIGSHYKNPVQYTGEMIDYLGNYVLTSEGLTQYAIIADTEWLGGSKAGNNIIAELGYQIIGITGDKVELVEKGSHHMQITKGEASQIQDIINKVKKADANKIAAPNLNDDEYRTLKDLINISSNLSMDPEVRAQKQIKNKVIDGDNIIKFIDDAQEGLNILTGGKEAKLYTQMEAAEKINERMLHYKGKMEQEVKDKGIDKLFKPDVLVFTHNGLAMGSDLDVWNKSKPISKILGGDKKHVDTLSIMKTILKDPLTEFYGDIDSLNQPLTLSDIARVVLPKDVAFEAHTAGDDARTTGYLFKYLWEDPDKKGFREKLMNILPEEPAKWETGMKLYSTGSVMKETPLDMIIRYGEDGEIKENRYYSSMATYRNATYEIQEEFQTKYGDDIYYGIILKNEDDKTTHWVTAKSQRELQSKIQGNFVAMDEAIEKGSEASRNYVMSSRAMTEYSDMFSGPNAPYRFEKYMDATAYIKANIKNPYDTTSGLLKNDVVETLIKEGKLTYSQANKFQHMYQRIDSEYNILSEFKTILDKDTSMKNSSKSAALWKLKEQIDDVYGEHKTSLLLPTGTYNQGRIRDFTGDLVNIDLRSQENLTRSVSRILSRDKYSDFSYNLSDIKANARSMITKMSAGPNAILDDNQAKNLISTIDKLNVKSITGNEEGYTRGVSYISQAMSQALYDIKDEETGIRAIDLIERVTEIADQESLEPRNINKAKRGKRKLTKEKMEGIKNWGSNYFATKDSPLKFNVGQVETKLNMIDRAIVGHINDATGGAIRKSKDNIGPTKIIDQLEDVARQYRAKGIKMQMDLSEGDKVGLQIKLFADQYATSITGYKGKNSVDAFIALIDPKTGLFQGSTRTVNLVAPVIDKSGKIRYSTYQEQLIGVLSRKNVMEIVERGVKSGDVASATNYINKLINDQLQGIPIGSMYNKEINNNLVSSNRAMNRQRRGIVDLNNLIYSVTKKNSKDGIGLNPTQMRKGTNYSGGDYFVDGTRFLQFLYLGPEYVEKNFDLSHAERIALKDAAEVKKAMSTLGIKDFTFGSLKGERVQKGFVNLVKEDAREYFVGGYYGDPAREMARQGLNFFEMSMDDWVKTEPGTLLKRSDVFDIGWFDTDAKKLDRQRRLSRFSETNKFNKTMNGVGNTVTLKAAFLTDKNIADITRTNTRDKIIERYAKQGVTLSPNQLEELVEQELRKTPITEMLTVHDEMGVIRKDILPYLTVNKDKNLVLGPEFEVAGQIANKIAKNEEYTLRPGDVIGVGPGNQKVEYDGRYDIQVRGYTYDEKKRSYILVGDQVIEAGEGTKLTESGGASKLTTRVVNSIDNQLGPGFEDIEALLNPSMDKGGSGASIAAQVNMAMEQIQLVDMIETVGGEEKRKIQGRVNEIAEDLTGVSITAKFRKNRAKSVKNAMQDEVNFILRKHLGTTKVKFVEQEVNGVKFTTAVIPTNAKKDFYLDELMNDFNTFFEKYGINTRTNVIQVGDTKVRKGLVGINVMDVDPGNNIVGAAGEQVKIGTRNLEFLYNRSKYLDVDLSTVTDYFEEAIGESAKDYKGQGKWLGYSLLDANDTTRDIHGNRFFDTKEVGYIKTTGKTIINESDYFKVKEFGDLNTFSLNGPEGQVYRGDLNGSIVDNIFDNRAFYVELPEEVAFGKDKQYKVNKVLMVPTDAVEGPDGVRLRNDQKAQKSIYDAIAEYQNFQKMDKSLMDPDEINKRSQEINNRLNKVVENYYETIGIATQGSDGDYINLVSSTRVSHSGRFAARGVSASEEAMSIFGDRLKEGEILITSDAFKEMIAGGEEMTEEFRDQLLDRARADGIYGMTIRDPVKDYTSQLPINLKVMTEAEEKAYRLVPGAKQSAIMTLGTQIALGADFDGDQFSLLMPSMGGAKAKNLQELTDSDIFKTMENWFLKEQIILEEEAVFYREHLLGLDKKTNELQNKMFGGSEKEKIKIRRSNMPGANAPISDSYNRTLEVASRINKQVGQMSVVASRYRALAETVGSASVDEASKKQADYLYNLATFMGSGNEQGAISSKRLADIFKDGIAETEGYQKYMNASDKLVSSLKNFDGKESVQAMIDMGVFEQVEVMMGDETDALMKRHYKLQGGAFGEYLKDEAGDFILDAKGNKQAQEYWRLKGGKTEGMFLGLLEFGDPDVIVTDKDVLGWFNSVQDTVGKDQAKRVINSGASGLGFATPYSADKAIENAKDIFVPNTTNAVSSTPFNRLSTLLYGEKVVQDHSSQIARGTERYSKSKPIGATHKKTFSQGATETAEEAASEAAKNLSSDMLSKVGMGAAVLGGGAWLASMVLPGPSVKRQVQQGQEDQAPSSDGTYINPAIYAGAPPGAAPPTARVSPMGAGYDKMNINITASSMNGMTNEEIAGAIAEEVQRQSGLSMNINIKSEDNTANIDRQWLQQQFSNVLQTGWTR